MKKLGTAKEFKKELFVDNGYENVSQGVNNQEMQIWVEDDAPETPREISTATIEWCYFVGKPHEDAVQIGCCFENGRLVDYDGVFELPSEAVKLLRANGFVVPREFE